MIGKAQDGGLEGGGEGDLVGRGVGVEVGVRGGADAWEGGAAWLAEGGTAAAGLAGGCFGARLGVHGVRCKLALFVMSPRRFAVAGGFLLGG